jgi:hypothetical protein
MTQSLGRRGGELGHQTPGTSPKQPLNTPPITHPRPHPRSRVRAWLLMVNEPASPVGPSFFSMTIRTPAPAS